jgi:ubiquinol-cytochrome c reductase cytochrome b subunit
MLLWPFIERRLTGDRSEHHLLDRPREAPMRSGVGAGALTFAAVLTFAGSNDVLGPFLGIPVEDVTNAFRWLVLLLPPLVGYLTYRLCRSLAERGERPIRAPRHVSLRRTREGGFEEAEP